MATLTDHDLELIRDEIGPEPDDDTIAEMFTTLGNWTKVALRVLKRRRAQIATGTSGVKSFSLDSVLSVGMNTGDIRALDSQIARLETLLQPPQTGSRIGRIVRPDR